MKAPLQLWFSLSVLAVLGCAPDDANPRATEETRKVELGASAPAYSAVSLAGDSVSIAGLHGKVVLLNVWATWCHPCRTEIPELRALHAQFAPRGLQLVGVSVDADGSDDAIQEFMKEFSMNYEIWRDPGERIMTTFLTVGVPATFLIDRNGVLRWRKVGPIERGDSTLTTAITQALAL
jgi:cytochrome c biogenesis protein CcmG, thiol:disulfide interchange protein DsbE